VLLAGTAASNVSAQNSKSLLRTIHGTVVDRNEAAVKSCVVYLKNLRTSDVTTRISDDSGLFRFSGLDPNADYQIQAQHGGTCSDPRTISSFDSRTDVNLTLKLNRDKCK
jgi:Carboxypeptidase regulatory-like domain